MIEQGSGRENISYPIRHGLKQIYIYDIWCCIILFISQDFEISSKALFFVM